MQNQKKKEKPVIRNDQLVIEKEVQAKPQVQPGQKYGLLRSLLMGPVGILLWSAMFVAAFLFLYRKVFLFEASHPE